jgi:hypothetical protein
MGPSDLRLTRRALLGQVTPFSNRLMDVSDGSEATNPVGTAAEIMPFLGLIGISRRGPSFEEQFTIQQGARKRPDTVGEVGSHAVIAAKREVWGERALGEPCPEPVNVNGCIRSDTLQTYLGPPHSKKTRTIRPEFAVHGHTQQIMQLSECTNLCLSRNIIWPCVSMACMRPIGQPEARRGPSGYESWTVELAYHQARQLYC